MLPVLDDVQRVVGTLSLVDILKHTDLETYAGVGERLMELVRHRSNPGNGTPRVVGHFMARDVVTASEDTHIVELVPLLSDQGLHHIPIVDAQGRLTGVVTQSDLVAALHAACPSPKDLDPVLQAGPKRT